MTKEMVRIANGQGFWGDSLLGPIRLVEEGPLDYLTLDYLAEVTMSIMQKLKLRDPNAGYATDFVEMLKRILPRCKQKGIKVVANAGGVNPRGCRDAIRKVVQDLKLKGVKIGIVEGDDILARLPELMSGGEEFKNLDTGAPVSSVLKRLTSANVYIGAKPIADALAQGADVVITGRATDPSIALGPLLHEFGWSLDDYDRLAAGTIMGHILECGPQCTGGNYTKWREVKDFARIGWPIAEASEDGTFVVTKHPATGGRVHSDVVKEQLLYELGDPKNYITPDCVADFTTIHLDDIGPGRVRVSGIRGRERPATLKLSISYENGWKSTGTLIYSWPQALEKARAAEKIVRGRLAGLGLHFDEIYTEFFGVNACHGPLAQSCPDPPEVQLRIGVRGPDRKAIDRFTRELIPLVLNGPPGATGFGEGRPPVREIVAYWSALVPREEIRTSVEVLG